MKGLVLDCSIAGAWCFPDEDNLYANRVLELLKGETRAFVPPIWWYEIANLLIVGRRRRRLTPAESARFLNMLTSLSIRVFVSKDLPQALVPLGFHENLSGYDAAYLHLAMQLGFPLATLDEGLRRAAKRVEVADIS